MKILEQQETGICSKSVKIEISVEDIESELQGVYKEFIDNAQVPGFRKGKAPRQIVKMKFGKHLDEEAHTKSIETAFKKAMEELNLKPVTTPEFSDPDKEKNENEGDEKEQPVETKKEGPFVIEAKFEYVPEITLSEYKDIQPDLPPVEVTEKDVVERLNRIRENNAMFETIDDRAVRENDFVSIDSLATIDGEAFPEASQKDISVEVGSKRYIPGLEDGLIGMAIGEKKELDLTLPDNYPNEEKRGKQAHFQIEVKSIREKRLPELDDEFAKDMGNFETLASLKERIREDLSRNLEERQKQQLRNGIRQELLKRNQFDVPPSMVHGR